MATVEFGLIMSLCLWFSLPSLMMIPNKDKQTYYQTELSGRHVIFKVHEDVFDRVIVSFGTLIASWHRWQGFDCMASRLK